MPVSQPLTAETLQALSSQGLVKSGGMTADGKRIIVVKKSATGIFSTQCRKLELNLLFSLTSVLLKNPNMIWPKAIFKAKA